METAIANELDSEPKHEYLGDNNLIYEMRVYEAMPGKMPSLNKRFADITMGFFKKHDIQVVGFWTEEIGANNKLIYMLKFHDFEHRQKAWESFRADQERAKAFLETEKEGPLVARIENRILRLTEYSPLI
jgi:hypothetical protein